jgi:hypothetical protein
MGILWFVTGRISPSTDYAWSARLSRILSPSQFYYGGKVLFRVHYTLYASLTATMVRWCEAGVNEGLLPMTISEEKGNLFCA